jgi:hypothetical protein
VRAENEDGKDRFENAMELVRSINANLTDEEREIIRAGVPYDEDG